VSCQLWLDPVNPDERNGQFLCRDHAERLSPPRGWVVVDRRGAQTAIRTSSPVATVQRVAPRRVARRRWGSFEEPTLEFTRDDVLGDPDDVTLLVTPISIEPVIEDVVITPEPPPVPPEVGQEPEPPAAIAQPVVEPVVDEPEVEVPVPAEPEVADDLTKLLKPRGGLLGRAFEATGHQRSALTIPDED
jgi:hypothetical protein